MLHRIRGRATAPTPSAPLPATPLDGPSYTAQVLLVAARLVGVASATDLTPAAVTYAMNIATESVLGTLPEVVAEATRAAVREVLPEAYDRETRGEYALRLREIAGRV
ncbi:hypothetical protein ACFQ9H_19415 [Streptomyces sp. NPDC056517]|uniref:hypothetical protein n=1 Tax=Streptomyces sp. NPDC056517 TaxID=3345848 RepID=UPI0036CA0B0C